MSAFFKSIFIVCTVLCSSNVFALDGFLEPIEEVEISTPETGVIIKTDAKEGLTVKKGQLLVQLDSSVLRASFSGVKADYESKKDKQVELESLFNQQIASADEVKNAQTETAIALSQYQTLQRQISRRLIKSPINGIITQVTRDAGELVSQTQGPFIKIVNVSTLKLTVYIPYEQTVNLKTDQKLSVKINSIDDLQEGVIRYIAPVVDPASSTVKVELAIDNSENQFRSGVPASVQLVN